MYINANKGPACAQMPITGWQDMVLHPTSPNFYNQTNIIYQHSIHSINRKYVRLHKHKGQNVNIMECLAGMKSKAEQHNRFSKTDKYAGLSNIESLKQMIHNIEKQTDRWEQLSTYKTTDYALYKTLPIKQGFKKIHTEVEQKSSQQRKIMGSHNTIFDKSKKQRPLTCFQRNNYQQSMTITNSISNQKCKTIHSKSYIKQHILKYFKKSKQKKSNRSLNICINQLQNQSMNKILKCLEKRVY